MQHQQNTGGSDEVQQFDFSPEVRVCDEPHDGTTMHLSMMNETQFVGEGVVGQYHRNNRDIFEFMEGNSAMNATVSATVEDLQVQRP